ncbi:MAG: terminase small subunit [Pyramidobacter sp.]|nr:terminase small subunit [Pyramidobacter sp.]
MGQGKLTPKQARFVEEYLLDLNAAAAARRAGYSEKNADSIAAQLLRKTKVFEAVQSAVAARSAKAEITAEYVLENLKRLSERCMSEKEFAPSAAARALELLGKHLGLFSDRVELSGSLSVLGVLGDLTKRVGDEG